MKITVYYTEDSVLGDAMGVAPDNLARYGTMLRDAIRDAYPDAEVEVNESIADIIVVNSHLPIPKVEDVDEYMAYCDQREIIENETKIEVGVLAEAVWHEWATEPQAYDKYVIVCGPMRTNPVRVHLNGMLSDEKLSPSSARRACQAAVGRRYGRIVWDEQYGHGYALYPNTHRRMENE